MNISMNELVKLDPDIPEARTPGHVNYINEVLDMSIISCDLI